MNPEQDPLWYDREESDESLGPLTLLTFLAVIIAERIMFLPGELWQNLKLGTIAAFQDVMDLRR